MEWGKAFLKGQSCPTETRVWEARGGCSGSSPVSPPGGDPLLMLGSKMQPPEGGRPTCISCVCAQLLTRVSDSCDPMDHRLPGSSVHGNL